MDLIDSNSASNSLIKPICRTRQCISVSDITLTVKSFGTAMEETISKLILSESYLQSLISSCLQLYHLVFHEVVTQVLRNYQDQGRSQLQARMMNFQHRLILHSSFVRLETLLAIRRIKQR